MAKHAAPQGHQVLTFTHVLWIIDFLVIVALLVATAELLTWFRRRRGEIDQWIDRGFEALDGRPSIADLLTALSPVLFGDDAALNATGATRQSLFMDCFNAASSDELARIDAICIRSVKSITELCKLVDAGLLRPRDIARLDSELHLDLIIETRLTEPYIWFKWICLGRGRWGLRLPQLADALTKLRANSASLMLCEEISVSVPRGTGSAKLVLCDPIRPWPRRYLRLINYFRSCTIDRRSKVRMAKERRDLAKLLNLPPSPAGTAW